MFWKKKRTAAVLEKYTFQLGDGDDLMLRPPEDKYKQMWQQSRLVRSKFFYFHSGYFAIKKSKPNYEFYVRVQ